METKTIIVDKLKDYVFGKNQPQAQELEEAVLGAILLKKTAIQEVRNILQPVHFYDDKHQILFECLMEMAEKEKPIDILTVTEELRRKRKNGKKLLEIIGAPFYLVELTNRVASAANIAYHARIIYQKYLSREAIKSGTELIQKAYEETEDIFDLRNDFSDKLRTTPPQSLLRSRTMNQSIVDAAQQAALLNLVGPFFSQTELAFLFADTGVGKTILSVQIADAISKGEDLFKGLLRNEVKAPQKVLYIDLELSDKQHERRYKSELNEERYEFSDLFIRADFNPNFIDLDQSLSKLVLQEIENLLLIHKPKVLIIDNITYLSSENNQDASVAMDIMKKLRVFRIKYMLSILVLSHTPKRNKTMPISINDLAGSKHLSNFAQSVFAIGECVNDPTIRYLKQLKGSNHSTPYDKHNVLVCTIEKDNWTQQLKYNYMTTGREQNHLADFADKENQDALLQTAYSLWKEKQWSYAKIAAHMELPWSSRHLGRLLKKYDKDQGQADTQIAESVEDKEPSLK